MSEEVNNWLDAAIEREAIPKTSRIDTIEKFAKKWKISTETYYYQMRKPENQKKVLEICLSVAKHRTPEILQKLADNAEEGKEKSIEMYLKFILDLTEKADLTSGGLPMIGISEVIARKYDLNKE